MFSSISLLAFVTLALSVAAKPVINNRSPFSSIPFSKAPITASGHDLVLSGVNRAQNFKQQITARDFGETRKRQLSVPVDNIEVSYIASVDIGVPATQYKLIIDTGSSNTWVGANQTYKPSLTSKSTGDSVFVSYGSGEFSGTEYIDFVDLGSGLVIAQQSIGVASSSTGFTGVDGILGIGPTDLTKGTVQNQDEIPTVTDSLFHQGTIFEKVVGISFEPIDTSGPVTNGELTFGGTDSSKYEGDITYTPRVGNFWGIEQSITYNGETIQATTTGIVDTGSTLLFLATEVLNKYISATGGVFDDNTGLYAITPDQYDNLQDLVFNIGGVDFSLTPNAQIWPRSLNADIGGTAEGIYLIVADNGPATSNNNGTDVNFIDGQVFLERFYSVYDTSNSRVGIANTPLTTATSN